MHGIGLWALSADDAPADPQTLADELDEAAARLSERIDAFTRHLSVPLVDYSHVEREYVAPDGQVRPLRGTGVGRTIYLLTAQRLATAGKVLRASGIQSHAAASLWRRLLADPLVPTRHVTVSAWSSDEARTYPCIDYTGAVPHISGP